MYPYILSSFNNTCKPFLKLTMGIHNCSTSNTTFIFPPPSQETPLIMHHFGPSSGCDHTSTNAPDLRPSSWTTTLPLPLHFNRILPPPSSPPSSQSSHGGFFKSVVDGLQYAYEGSTSTTSPSTENQLGFQAVHPGSDPFGIQPHETGNKTMSAQEMVDAKAVAASKSHSEAERRRRERINNHLTKLRSLLPNTTKTDKASLLAEVIQHVKELKRQTSIIAEQGQVPTEINEVIIDKTSDAEGRVVIRASLCCEDRSDLLPDLIKTLKMLRLRTLKAEITTLGRRVKNVLFVTGEEDHYISNGDTQMVNQWISVIEEALKAVVKKTDDGDDSSFGSGKRQRTNNGINIFGHRRSL